jgi:N12 class adenine-specific DNA methylase
LTKYQLITSLYAHTIGRVTETPAAWKTFLKSACRNYKCRFDEQILIYGQRPDATAVLEIEKWNDPYGRWLNRGTKGIAVFNDEYDGNYRLKHYFDISDTYQRSEGRPLPLWDMKPEYEAEVIESLENSFGELEEKGSLAKALISVAKNVTQDNLTDYFAGLIESEAENFPMQSGEPHSNAEYSTALKNSVAFMIMSRCGIDTEKYFSDEDFHFIMNFNTQNTVNALGIATSDISEMCLKEISIAALNLQKQEKNQNRTFAFLEIPTYYIRSKLNEERGAEHDRSIDVQNRGRLPDTEPERAERGADSPWQIRINPKEISEREPQGALPELANQRGAEQSPDGDRADSERNDGTFGRADEEAAGREREAESEESNAVGGTDEQHQKLSGRNDTERTDIRIKPLPTKQEQLTFLEKAEEVAKADSSAFSISEQIIDEVLTSGGNEENSTLRIVAYFKKDYLHIKNAEFLKNEYSTGGKGFVIDGTHVSVWFDDDGLHLAKGDTTRTDDVTHITWKQAAKRIRELLDLGRYMPQSELNKVDAYEIKALANNIWYINRDIHDDYKPAFLDAELGNGVFPDATDRIAELISEPEKQKEILTALEKFATEFGQNTSLLRSRHSAKLLIKVLDGLTDLQHEPLTFTADETIIPAKASFITQDELDRLLIGGGNIEQTKLRIYSFFLNEHSDKEKVDFLKNEYGTGDRGRTGYNEWHDSKGISLSRGSILTPYDKVLLSWPKVAKRIGELISENRYMSKQELEYISEYEKEVLANKIYNFYLNKPEEISRPYPYGAHYDEAKKSIRKQLDETNRVAKIIEGMSAVLDNTADFDRNYDSMQSAYYDLKAYQNGTFSLFTNVNIEIPQDEVDSKPEEVQINDVQAEVNDVPVEVEEESLTPEIAPYMPKMGDKYEINDRKYIVDSVNFDSENVSLRDITFAENAGFPIFRSESLAFLRLYSPIVDNEPEIIDVPDENKPTLPERHNYRIPDDYVGISGQKARYKGNVDAISTLRTVEAENRFATQDEQQILAGYTGWGGISQAFDAENKEWESEYSKLKDLLEDEEYKNARASTLNAFYTSKTVVSAIYKALENMGFKTGNILEPSCGTGNFFGLLPESMKESKLYGVELDSLTGRIAKQLYQKGNIDIQGFETTNLPDSFFDIALGNVPFGDYKVANKRYDKHNFLIHDYFFAHTLDKVRPGGIVAFVTSKGTLDKQNPAVRKYIAQRAELIGAIRLPNNAFYKNAGTQVTADIIFLQKRERIIDTEPSWVHLGVTEKGIPVNSYFAENPTMVLGEMSFEHTLYGKDETTCRPFPESDLAEQLAYAITNIHAEISEYEREQDEPDEENSIPADPLVRNFSFTTVHGQIYYRQDSKMVLASVPVTAQNRIKGLIQLRECVRNLILYQTDNYPESAIKAEQEKLGLLYDNFVKKYGLINSRGNSMAFGQDSAYCLLCSLEILDENGELERKADMFDKRTIKPNISITRVDTASEALSVSLSEKAKVDLPYMSQLTGKSEEVLFSELEDVIFLDPDGSSEIDSKSYVTAEEYLSGNVRKKLEAAEAAQKNVSDGRFDNNVKALSAALPPDLTAAEISVRLGATWLPPAVIEKFVYELLKTPRWMQNRIKVNYINYTGEWNISEKSADRSNIHAFSTYGTQRIGAYKIIEDSLNLRDVRIFDKVTDIEGNEKRVLNKKETAIAQAKQEVIRSKFNEWIWEDADRRTQICQIYNEKFNSIKPREYDGSHLNFAHMNPEISLRKHQIDAIARIIHGGNTLLAHVVGAGKTFEMVAAAMESKRLGLCNKSLIVVPNHITEQWSGEFLQLYPSANILVATKRDFETKNRKKFCARIATGDYDAVIIGHSQFEKIPISHERQKQSIENQITDILNAIYEMKRNRGERATVRQMERLRKSLETRLKKLNDQSKKDDVINFEELGVDKLFIDEAHYYKNLFLLTKMRNVGGIAQVEAQKTTDLYLKCRYLDELTGGRGIVFATGTPISNSMAELYTMQRYLQYEALTEGNLQHFDAWASTFGETVTAIELAPEGTGYRSKTRFAKFHNIPELMNMFKLVADIQTEDMLKLPVPDANFHNVVVKPNAWQKEMVEELAERAEAVRSKSVDPSVDNMLKITSDGRKLALDQRIINEMLPDDPDGKVSACAENVYRIWEETSDKRLAQLIFCDLSTPKNDDKFNVYDDMRAKLISKGIPNEEIAFIHNADSEIKKKELFAKVRKGLIRVLLGSTQKMGAGTNVQDKLIALHDLDCPWRPSDLAQRLGRIVRQGNSNPVVEIFRYVTEGTFDSYLYQLVENKQKFIAQIMTSKLPVRIAEDVDETALNYAEIKALATGNPLIIEKCQLESEVNKLNILHASHLSQKYALEDKILKEYPKEIKRIEGQIDGLTVDIATLQENTSEGNDNFMTMKIGETFYNEKADAGKAIIEACKSMTSPDPVLLGEYRGFKMELSFDVYSKEYQLILRGALSHEVKLGSDIHGNITRINNKLESLSEAFEKHKVKLEDTKAQFESAKGEVDRPFPQEQEYAGKSARLKELNILLNLNEKDNEILEAEPDEGDIEAAPRNSELAR